MAPQVITVQPARDPPLLGVFKPTPCQHCGKKFLKNRKDKVYCSPNCHDATRNPARSKTCLNCGNKFVTSRRNKVYCTPECQNPYLRYGAGRKIHAEFKRVLGEMSDLDGFSSMPELTTTFEAVTGTPFFIRLENLPRRRSFKAVPDLTWEDTTRRGFHWGREEQGQLWWNVAGIREDDPVEIERKLLARDPGPVSHQGETPAEWRLRGGQVRVLPPGKAIAL